MADDKPGTGWGEIVGFLLLAIAVVIVIWPRSGPGEGELVPKGTPLPELMVEGWLNTSATVSSTSLQGKVVLVDCWATWCPPCRESLPGLARLYAEYKPLGVEFVGLTPEAGSAEQVVDSFIQSTPGFDWPVGYGSMPTLDMLGIQYFPTLIVFDKSGRVIWSSTSTQGLRAALDEALAI